MQTYARTPAADNVYQEFKTCPEGKIINPDTGNCVNEPNLTEAALKLCPEGKYLNILTGRCKNLPTATTAAACKEGYYRNPLTGRCKKNVETTTKTCADGYELNPETNRCRKIRASNLSDYPVEEIKEEQYDNPKIFVALWAILALGASVIVYIVIQFRHEIVKFFSRRILRRRR